MTERLLLLTPFFHPEPIGTGKYNSFLAMALVREGVAVDVLCFHPIYPDWRPRRSSEGLPGMRIYRGGAWMRFPRNTLLRRAVLECGFLFFMFRHARRIRRHSQIVAVLPPMLYLPFVHLIASRHARVTAIVHDLQGVMAGVGNGRVRRTVVRLVRRLEAAVFGCAHRVFTLSEAMATFLSASYGIAPSKVTVCWPFVSIDTRYSTNHLERQFAADKKHIVYAGALGDKQNPYELIAFFQNLAARRKDVVCHIFSGGPIFKALRRRAANGHRLMFHDFIPEQQLYELYLRSHIQVIPEKPGFANGAFPSKLPNLLAAGVPVLYIGQRDSDVCRMIHGTDAGLCAEGWDFANLNDLVDQLLLEGGKRSHADRRQAFNASLKSCFSIDPLVKELVG